MARSHITLSTAMRVRDVSRPRGEHTDGDPWGDKEAGAPGPSPGGTQREPSGSEELVVPPVPRAARRGRRRERRRRR
ncbi:hypothetical protein ACQEU5_15605 [Marinactinospora thermotolerans]|uniref:Uncharacterized protein n=1 Tax=Marinactinospora thermotolerans DSM 45154 TaxID=1122192 RepID=A0A1T4T9L5_9ACTN|nr:hypothetical protein [Marinactinospora thermotolerans]SKA36969.1 hypothetical protein SAMN02745673_04663 [Marinactinospora thermotolerans DSM 45154]